MTTKELSSLIGKTISIHDQRTGRFYDVLIHDAKTVYGNLRLRLACCAQWFEPTAAELASVKGGE